MPEYVAYYRVSTDKQGIKGLGMDAQREAVSRFMTGKGDLAAQFVEVESGRKNNRPQLAAALAECRKRRAVLVIAKLGSPGAECAFHLRVDEQRRRVCRRRYADRQPAHHPHSRRRTQDDLAAHQGGLGGGEGPGHPAGHPRAAAAVIARAAKNIQAPPPEVLALITGWRDQGRGYRDIARELNRLNIRTPQEKQWYASTVRAQLSVSKN
jgi:hypothetical protein